MLKNDKRKEVAAFEQAMGPLVANLGKATITVAGHGSYPNGKRPGFEYALTIYCECRRDGTT